ncbi:MAG: efflux RND transporter periplasmic adaptor subunit [Ignavibacteriaceae bacterium]|nr:efflux RND transporter periplasmic adaptor subunit [Ignavibacteriaceae bacterium]
MKKIALSVISLSILLLLSGCGEKEESTTTNDVIPVRVVLLTKTPVKKNIFSSGQFTTGDEAILSFKTGGVIKSIYVKEGDAVKKGQLLASLELTEIEAGVEQASAGYEKSLRDYNRVKQLYEDSVATLAQMQDAKTGFDVATQQFAAAKFNRNYSEIRALENGFILKKISSEGQIVGPGTPVLMTNGAGRGNWKLQVAVSDNEWAAVRVGDQAFIETDAAPGEKFSAVVSAKSEGVDPYTGTFSLELRLTSRPRLLPASGMFGRAEIVPSLKRELWTIPFESVLDGEGSTGYVFVSRDGETAQKIRVTIADFDGKEIFVSSGLENVKYLITTGSAYLRNNSKIKISGNK